MVIRSEQVEKLDDAAQLQYHEKLRVFFRQNYPDLVSRYDDPTLLARIAEGNRNAEGYNMQTDQGFVAYIGMSLAAGPDFHTDPKIKAYMDSPGRDPDAKMEWLFNRVVEKLRAHVPSASLQGPIGQ